MKGENGGAVYVLHREAFEAEETPNAKALYRGTSPEHLSKIKKSCMCEAERAEKTE